MVRCLKIVSLALLSGGLLLTGLSPQSRAATSSNLDILPGERTGDGDTVDLGDYTAKVMTVVQKRRVECDVHARG